ncbi:MAG: TraB/GumN family protein [Erythrobacter sp.]|nr:MAG: TraB/GumN family protein [Erythrobacter sp.]
MTKPFLRRAMPLFAALLLAVPAAAQDSGDGLYAFTQDYEPAPALWRLSDEDTTLYLLGTFHALPRGFEWRSAQLDAIIEEADVLVVESSDFGAEPDAIDVDAKLTARLQRRLPTSSRLSAPGAARWRQLVAMSGHDFVSIDSMPLLLGLLTMGMTGGGPDTSSPLYGVETVLEREFLSRDRPILTIEDSGGVMYSLLRLDNSELVGELEAKLSDWDGKSLGHFFNTDYVEETGDAYWVEEHNWARGVVADDFDMGFGDGPIGQAFDFNLLARRNADWAAWLEARLAVPGTALVAVGSGHFEGEESLLAMIERRGLVAERID